MNSAVASLVCSCFRIGVVTLIIDKQLNDGMYTNRHSQEENWTETTDLAVAHIHTQIL